MDNISQHTFHIPVMGLGFTIDTPTKVAKYGVTSVVSIMEDHLIEQMREVVSKRENYDYNRINENEYDYRAKRITEYLNLLNNVVNKQTEKIKSENFETDYDINNYFKLLPDSITEKKIYQTLNLYNEEDKKIVYQKLKDFIKPGSIDVNIMTKLDKVNYDKNGNELPNEFSDALSALRGYANSELNSSIIFSAGLNPRLFTYCESFPDFFPDEKSQIKKKIVLKVSDYRSALIQGKFLAKKGLWVSEFRIESGINCGGHTFISNGILLGPILEEFKLKRNELLNELLTDCNNALSKLNKNKLSENPDFKITAQGGVGTTSENDLLIEYYKIDSVGWGSPFLLVPEVTNVDYETLQKLAKANTEDYFLSEASPLGVPFNNFRLSSSEEQRKRRIAKNKPGSPCYKKFLSNNKEFTERVICTASRQYQNLKINQIKASNLSSIAINKQIELVKEKDCLCEGLGASALLVSKTKLSHNLSAVAICPGPNLAYFSGIYSFKQMVDHIYGKTNILNKLFRPNFFIKELELYVDYLKKEIEKYAIGISNRNESFFKGFIQNLFSGINYYENLSTKLKAELGIFNKVNIQYLDKLKETINQLLDSFNEEKKLVY
ncbi:MAG: hypothetical protein LCH32_05725 [Bacteroidetes bacterium]|nr:hypothetical protein [Bacteroidota bacterium]